MIKYRQLAQDALSFLSGKIHLMNMRKIALILVVILFFGFIVLSVLVFILPTTHIDISLSQELQEERHPMLDFLMKWISIPGERAPAIGSIAVVAITCMIFKYFKEALFVVFTSLASVMNTGLKLLIHRQRPTADVVEKVVEAQYYSFPSGHTVFYVVFYGFLVVLIFKMTKVKIWIKMVVSLFFILLIFAIPFSRVYLGAHWFSDVLGGFIFGIIYLSILLYFYFKKNNNRPVNYK